MKAQRPLHVLLPAGLHAAARRHVIDSGESLSSMIRRLLVEETGYTEEGEHPEGTQALFEDA
jgi:hypothetical protein